MSANLPKWTEERTTELEQAAKALGGNVSREQAEELATTFGTSIRSIAAKLRKIGFEVSIAAEKVKAFSDEQTAQLTETLTNNSGVFTYAELGEALGVSAKAVQGKILSLQLTDHVKPTPKAEPVRQFSDTETNTIIRLTGEGKSLEQISDTVGRSLNSVRGKALSLFKQGMIAALPVQATHKESVSDIFEGVELANFTVVELAEMKGKTPRGIKTILTRRELVCADYPKAKRTKAE